MPISPRVLALLFLAALLLPVPSFALTVLGTGSGALLGGDLTDPENDGNDSNGTGFNWLSTAASSENNFGGEGALDVFDNQVGSGSTKWCCTGPPQWVAVELAQPYVLTHFTIAAGNDVAQRDPTTWAIEGSLDGSAWTPIFQWNNGTSPFSNRLEVIRFDGDGQDFATPAPYSWFRYHVTGTDNGHQINELEFFGVPVVVFNDFSVDKPLIPTGEAITLSWDLDPGVTSVSIDNGIGDVTAQTVNGVGQMTINPGPNANTTYTMTAVHPETTAQESVTVTVTDQPVVNSFTANPSVIAPGGSTTLQWDVFNTTSVDLNGSDVTGQSSLVVSPASSTTYTLTATNANGSDVANVAVTVVVPGEPVISEFMASNDGAVLVDEDSDSSDWIEIHNPSGNTAILTGYFLTDDPGDLQKWAFPSITLAPLNYLVVFASGKDRIDPAFPLHTNFSLSGNGEYLALVKADGVTIVSEFGLAGSSYPAQESGISFGNFGDPPQQGYFDIATPNAANSTGFQGFVADTAFDVNRGFFNTTQFVTISSATPGATIRYTTDGSWPSETAGTIYSGPVSISRTTPLRAIAYKANHRPTNVDTHTYIFTSDVITQSSSNTQSTWGLPSSWNGQPTDYGMNSSVVSLHNGTIQNDLKTVPSLSIVMDTDDMFGSNGIYSHPGSSGVNWERATSLELIDPANPDGSNDFQHDCGIRIQGGAFRSFGLTLKKSFRVLFKDIYGPSKLRYPLFGPAAAQQFDTLVFRMESNDGYQWGNRTNVQYARDEFGRRSQLAMGSPSSHGRYLHIYINGVYWGLYNAVERPDDSMGDNYFDSKKTDWDGVNSGSATNEGSTASWNTLKSMVSAIPSAGTEAAKTAIFMEAQGLNPDGTDNPAKADFIDIDNYIDYLIVNWYSGNNDWPHKNYYHGRERDLLDPAPRTGSRTSIGTHFFSWDAEWSLFLNSSTDKTGTTSGVAEPYGDLRDSEEFRVRFGDRAHRALFNDGAMTPQQCMDRYEDITKDHTSILIPELARWGDQHGTQRTIQNWTNEYNHIRNDWLATRTPAFVTVLRGANLYPQIDAVTYSQHGGPAPAGGVTMFTDSDTIYYTLDGTDPRLLGGGIKPGALSASFGGGGPTSMTYLTTGHSWKYWDLGTDPGAGWKTAGFNDNSWMSGPSQLGYGTDNEGSGTTLSFGPNSSQKFAATYFRTTVTVPDPTIYDHFLLRVKYDDACGLYLNETPVVLTSNLPNGENSAFNQYANGTVSNENAWKDFIVPTNTLVAGVNTIAVQIHQGSGGSSDIRLDVVLRGEIMPAGGGANESDPLFFSDNTVLTARSYNSGSGDWSALNQALFTVNVVPVDNSNIVISEMNYHPYEPVLPGEIAISTDRDDYEYLELLNVSGSTIDLTGVRFDEGISFAFADNTFLPAGNRLLLVRNLAAFTERYPSVGSTSIIGEYAGRLSNDGERILFTAPSGTLHDFVYNDQIPWPTAADGDGPSMILVDPFSVPNHGVGSNWRASLGIGGVPAGSDSESFASWKAARGIIDDLADPDGDQLNNFGEFAMGTAYDSHSGPQFPILYPITIGPNTHIGIDVRLSLAAMDDAELFFELSNDLNTWGDATSDFTVVAHTYHGDGTVTLGFQATNPLPGVPREFYRAVFQAR